MEKFKQIEKEILQSRLTKNELAKNLLQTLKGEYENAVKNGKPAGDSLVESLAKKMIKNAEIVGTEDAKKEIEILKQYVPVELSEDQVKSIIVKIMEGAPDKVSNYRLGNKGVIGWFMGEVMRETNKTVDAKLAGKLIQELLTA